METCLHCHKKFELTEESGKGKFCSRKCYYLSKKEIAIKRSKQDFLDGRKTCSSCNERKLFSDFIKDKKTVDGFRSQCKICSKQTRQKSKNKKLQNFKLSITEKKCNSCNIVRKTEEFTVQITTKDGLSPICKCCKNKDSRNFINKRIKNKLYIEPLETKVCYVCQVTKKKNEFYKSSRSVDGIRRSCIECERTTLKDKFRIGANKRRLHKYKTEPIIRMKKLLRGRINKYIKKKSVPMNCIIGCDWNELKSYIESKFIENMTWDNYGQFGWHLDHIIPLGSAKTEEELYKLSHYTNLQPLWWRDNLMKSDKILEHTNNSSI